VRNYAWSSPPGGTGQFVVIETDANGFNDAVYLSCLIQWFRLNLGESPFFANAGIPARQSVITGVAPDYYAMYAQQWFAPYFASIAIARQPGSNPPTYSVIVTTHSGSVIPLTLNVSAP
jgi:hypothetical protein